MCMRYSGRRRNGWWMVGLAFALAGAIPAWAGVEYTGTFKLADTKEPVLQATVKLTGLTPTAARLRLVLGDASARQLPKPTFKTGPEAWSDGARLGCQQSDAWTWLVSRSTGTTLEVRYSLPLSDIPVPASADDGPIGPVNQLADDHALLAMSTFAMVPEGVAIDRWHVEIEPPAGWTVRTPWTERSPRTFEADSVASVRSGLVVLGAWDVTTVAVGDLQLTVACPRGAGAQYREVVGAVGQATDVIRDWLGQHLPDAYLVAIVPGTGKHLVASGRADSLLLAVPTDKAGSTEVAEDVAYATAQALTADALARGLTPDDEMNWLVAGSSDYYANLLTARAGLQTWDTFGRRLESALARVAESPHNRRLSLGHAGGTAYASDRTACAFVHDAGHAVAAWLDRRLAGQPQGAHTLQDVLDALLRGHHRAAGENAGLTADQFLHALGDCAEDAAVETVRQLVRLPYRFDAVAALSELGVSMSRSRQRVPLTPAATFDGTTVIELEPDGCAYQVGLQPGDRLIEVNDVPVKATKEIHDAWAVTRFARIRLKLERDGHVVQIDTPIPLVTHYEVAPDAWQPATQP